MRSSFQTWRLVGGALAIGFLLPGSMEPGAPRAVASEKEKPGKSQPGTTKSNDLNLKGAAGGRSLERTDGELLNDTERRNRLAEDFLRAEVRKAVNQARARTAAGPERAVGSLERLVDKVRSAGELTAGARDQLVDQLQTAIKSARRQAQVQADQHLAAQQALAEGEARERMLRALFAKEEKVDQVMSRYDALMDEERYRDAEAVANIAEAVAPGRPGLRGAELTTRMTGYAANFNAVRDMRYKGFVDATMQIELSHIPTPGEPPILYPDPEVWQLLTERRKKYKAVDLTQHGPSETKILAALDETTEVDFADQALTDVVDYLKQKHDIEIQLDNKALADAGIGSDTPITRNLKGITLRSALKLLLGELDLTYVLRNEVLLITSRTEAETMVTTRVYPVADLVIPIANPRMGGSGGGMSGPGGGMTGGGMGTGMGGGMGGGMMGGMGMGGMGMGGMGMGGGMGGMF